MARFLTVLDTVTSVCIATAAAIETAIEVQRRLPDTEVAIVSVVGWPNFVPLALLIIVACIWITRLFLSASKTIQILAPLENGTVPAIREVRGSIWPAGEPVQIFVRIGQEWRPQQLPARDGAFWCAQCHFDIPAAAWTEPDFAIVAISHSTLIVGPVKRLPWWSTATSPIVKVTRRDE